MTIVTIISLNCFRYCNICNNDMSPLRPIIVSVQNTLIWMANILSTKYFFTTNNDSISVQTSVMANYLDPDQTSRYVAYDLSQQFAKDARH